MNIIISRLKGVLHAPYESEYLRAVQNISKSWASYRRPVLEYPGAEIFGNEVGVSRPVRTCISKGLMPSECEP